MNKPRRYKDDIPYLPPSGKLPMYTLLLLSRLSHVQQLQTTWPRHKVVAGIWRSNNRRVAR